MLRLSRMFRFAGPICLMLTLLSIGDAAWARGGRHWEQWDDRQVEQIAGRSERGERRQERREEYENTRRQREDQGRRSDEESDNERLRRLSPEERKQLRRQLHDAARDIYNR